MVAPARPTRPATQRGASARARRLSDASAIDGRQRAARRPIRAVGAPADRWRAALHGRDPGAHVRGVQQSSKVVRSKPWTYALKWRSSSSVELGFANATRVRARDAGRHHRAPPTMGGRACGTARGHRPQRRRDGIDTEVHEHDRIARHGSVAILAGLYLSFGREEDVASSRGRARACNQRGCLRSLTWRTCRPRSARDMRASGHAPVLGCARRRVAAPTWRSTSRASGIHRAPCIAMNNRGGDWVLVWAGTALLSFVGLCGARRAIVASCARYPAAASRARRLAGVAATARGGAGALPERLAAQRRRAVASAQRTGGGGAQSPASSSSAHEHEPRRRVVRRARRAVGAPPRRRSRDRARPPAPSYPRPDRTRAPPREVDVRGIRARASWSRLRTALARALRERLRKTLRLGALRRGRPLRAARVHVRCPDQEHHLRTRARARGARVRGKGSTSRAGPGRAPGGTDREE